jgi:hypothetical protein
VTGFLLFGIKEELAKLLMGKIVKTGLKTSWILY